jgi:Excreted virulence factor EspC, type VII ESX diderm
MPSHVGVRSAQLINHAGTVEAIADRVSTAASAGAAVRAGSDAYGQLCVMVPVMLDGLQDVLVDGIRSAAASLHDGGARLRTTAGEYHDADRRRAQVFNAMRGGR